MKTKLYIICFAVLFPALIAFAQYSVITAEQVKSRIEKKQKMAVIDVRLPDEYAEAHIPGAINIPAERMQSEKSKLPKDKSTPLIFYCRGVG